MDLTNLQFEEVINQCSALFQKKLKDYGPSWRILRPISVTDQVFIKAQRIRTIEQKGSQKIEDDVKGEFVGIVNYSAVAILQIRLNTIDPLFPPPDDLATQISGILHEAKTLMLNKNHDYGEAWREMRVSSFTDLILMRIQRIRQIEDNEGKTLVSEGIEANFFDIINYAVFALIKL